MGREEERGPIFERSEWSTATKRQRVGGRHQAGMYKHPKNNGTESIVWKGLEVQQAGASE